jgi:hypothetical protein
MSDPHPEIGTGLAGIPATTKGGSVGSLRLEMRTCPPVSDYRIL